MFDVGFSELLVLGIIALVVLGPEKLPHAARMAGAWIGRIRRTLINVQADIENEVASAEMRERIRKEMAKAEAAKQQMSADIMQSVSSSTPDAPRAENAAGHNASKPHD
ncbi:sec-independent protein translocase protein TatB [Paraperlucidibaca baekdonensis]|uniref:Sec-independent protein translocase protein TatB n=1 Tax=Paraperlucidibaca baekdonensis TaxID=748120 RepID=A0A3E0H9P6_9GAMM|nr:Sec-independent protein translocase protein TatB [Paraperlucidibaca baekdonensis]REH40419.1 sec-independent protein translocase protein TatB [Paraperlucidibaca baekdonensis]